MVATALTYPLLNIAVRLQVAEVKEKDHQQHPTSTSWLQDLVGDQGIKGLYA